MTWLRNILFAAAVCMVVDAARAQEPVRKPDVVPGIRDLSPGSEPYSGGTSVSRKPFTTLPGEVRRQPDAIADTLMRRVASGISADGYPSALPRTGADFSRDIFFYDYSSGGDLMRWKGGALAGSGSRVTMPGLLSRQKASLQAVHTVGNLMLTAGVTAGASTPSSIIEEVLSNMSEEIREEELSFEEMIEASLKPVYNGKVVKGIVTAVNPNEVTVDIGTKHTGFVKLEELTNDPTAKAEDLVKKGDELDLIVTKVNDQEGIVYLSKKRFDENKGKEEVAAAVESGEIMDGYVSESNSGGLVVLVNNVRVFVPRSQSTLRHGEDYTKLVKQNVKLRIKQCEGRHIVGSIREVLAEEADAKREAFWADVEVGKRYTGVVKSLTNYGAFVDIGGVDGLVHISELSWDRVKHPSEVVNVGDTIEVYVKDLDTENKKVSLGYKKAEDNPWEKFKAEYPIGTSFKAPVVSLTKFGAFVRILPGIDGLVHISEISHDRVEKVGDVLSVGQEVEVQLIDVDYDKKRISLSMKALVEELSDEEQEDAE